MTKRSHRPLISIGIALLALLLGIALIDFIYAKVNDEKTKSHWSTDPNTEFDSELGWRQIPNNCVENEWGKVCSNSHGFRSPEINPDKKHILFVGDSLTWGSGIGDQDVFTSVMNRRLAQGEYQFHNLAVPGYGIDQYYLLLKRHMDLFKKLDQVILMIQTKDDLVNVKSNVSKGRRKPMFVLENGELKLENGKINKNALTNLISQSYFLRHLQLVFSGLIGRLIGDKEQSDDQAMLVVTKLIDEIKTIAEERGAKFMIMLSPSSADYIKKTDHHQIFESMCYTYRANCANLQAIIRNQKEFPPPTLYLDASLYNEKGHSLLAWLFELGLLTKESSTKAPDQSESLPAA